MSKIGVAIAVCQASIAWKIMVEESQKLHRILSSLIYNSIISLRLIFFWVATAQVDSWLPCLIFYSGRRITMKETSE